jgi:tetratricopeptide (TPR) repeat protein
VLLTRQVWTGKPYVSLLVGFVAPVACIAWPSIQKVEIGKDTVTLEKYTQELRDKPTDPALRQSLDQQVKQITGRPISDPAVATTIAEAQFELGDHAAAQATVDKVLQAEPLFSAALDIKKRLELNNTLKDLTTRVEANSNDAEAKAKLEAAAHQAAQLKIASPELIQSAAGAELAIGHKADAAVLNNKALAINPASAASKNLRLRIGVTGENK